LKDNWSDELEVSQNIVMFKDYFLHHP